MKYLLNRYTFFILVFIAVFLFDFIIFQISFLPIMNNFPDNVTLGLAIMAMFFIMVPSIAAYRIAIKRGQGELNEQDKIKASRNRKITVGFILAIILILIIKNFTSVKVDPYTYQSITDQEFTKPLKIIAIKKIGEEKYYLQETKTNGVSLFQMIGENKADDRFLFDMPFEAKNIKDFWYDNSTNTTFVTEEENAGVRSRLEQIFKFSLYAKEDRIQVLKVSELGIYSGGDRILDYFPDSDNLLLESVGGDGCGGWGSLWLLNKERSQILKEYGSGCMSQDKPRYAGYDGKFLYFALFNSGESKYPGDFGIIGLKEIFKINPRTKENIVMPVFSYPEEITDVRLSENKGDLVMRTAKGKNFTLNLGNFLIKEASSSASN